MFNLKIYDNSIVFFPTHWNHDLQTNNWAWYTTQCGIDTAFVVCVHHAIM